MFSHVMVGVNDIEESKKFYDAIFAVLGVRSGYRDPKGRVFYMNKNKDTFGITIPIDGNDATLGNGSTIGFHVESTEQGDAWHDAGINNGGTTCEDPPGIREEHGVYLAYLRDPTGNKLCALLNLNK